METPKEIVIALQSQGLTITQIAALLNAPKDTVEGWRYAGRTTTMKRFAELKQKATVYLS